MKKGEKKYKFRTEVARIFSVDEKSLHSFDVWYNEDPKGNTVSFEPPTEGVSFTQLTQLAELFGTQKINFTGMTSSGYCTTGYSGPSPEIHAWEVQFD